ncbi:MAG: hypothetical protein H0U27_01595 [Nitrosopumilus sp.]|nr:hypothetical protein [Nitrosopumilus sp.]
MIEKQKNTNEYIQNEDNTIANHAMLTKKIKSSESAVSLKRISQLRRSGSSNSVICQCDQQKHCEKIQIKPLVSKNSAERMKKDNNKKQMKTKTQKEKKKGKEKEKEKEKEQSSTQTKSSDINTNTNIHIY